MGVFVQPFWFALITFCARSTLTSSIASDLDGGFIGCLFENVCKLDETCFDDRLFGKCVGDQFQDSLLVEGDPEIINAVRSSFNQMFADDVHWSDLRVQCILRTMIFQASVYGYSDSDEVIQNCKQGSENPNLMFQNPPGAFLSPKRINPPSLDSLLSIARAPSSGVHDGLLFPRAAHTGTIPELVAIRAMSEPFGASANTRKSIGIRKGEQWAYPRQPARPTDSLRLLSSSPTHEFTWAKNREFVAKKQGDSPFSHETELSKTSELENTPHEFDKRELATSSSSRSRISEKSKRKTTQRRLFSRTSVLLISTLVLVALLLIILAATYCIRYVNCPENGRKHDLNNVEYSAIPNENGSNMKPSLLQRIRGYWPTWMVKNRGQKIANEARQVAPEVIDSRASSSRESRSTLFSGMSSEKEPSKSFKTGQQPASTSQRSSVSSWSGEPFNSSIDLSTGHLILSYMEEFLRDEDRLSTDWEAVNHYEAEEATIYEGAQSPINKERNRENVPIPFEQSRVRLRTGETDYINASLIFDHSPRNPIYIATPSPMAATVSEFWQMIWEQNSVVIVCLERSNELRQPQEVVQSSEHGDASVQYWPSEGVKVYGSFEIHLVSEHNWCEDYLVRSIYVKNLEVGETRTVTQFHYLAWNECNMKKKIKSVLEFRRKVNRSFRGMMSPIVVHCIDGSGRSGTYILLDLVLNRIFKGMKEINIAASLEHLRDQRQRMVQTKDQYEFVFAAVAQEVDAMLKTTGQSN